MPDKWSSRKNGEKILLLVMKLEKVDNGLVAIQLLSAIIGHILYTGDLDGTQGNAAHHHLDHALSILHLLD